MECDENNSGVDGREKMDVESFQYAESTPATEQWGHSDLFAETFRGISAVDSAPESVCAYRRPSRQELADPLQKYDYSEQDSSPAMLSDSFNHPEEGMMDSIRKDSVHRVIRPIDQASTDEREPFMQQALVAEVQEAEERGRAKGMELGLKLGREEGLRQIENERVRIVTQAAELSESFSKASDAFFHQMEQEAVKLALAITARILHREAQSDPLLLSSAVRLALSQLARSTTVRLLVPAQDQAMWEETLALLPGLTIRPQVHGATKMQLGACVIETEISTADIGLLSQLKSLEAELFGRVEDQVASGGNGNKTRDADHMNGVNWSMSDESPDKVWNMRTQKVREEKN